ncbi:hypothetical protein DITRI_Ditri09bG0122200 [Diplodiscus trichospermus]
MDAVEACFIYLWPGCVGDIAQPGVSGIANVEAFLFGEVYMYYRVVVNFGFLFLMFAWLFWIIDALHSHGDISLLKYVQLCIDTLHLPTRRILDYPPLPSCCTLVSLLEAALPPNTVLLEAFVHRGSSLPACQDLSKVLDDYLLLSSTLSLRAELLSMLLGLLQLLMMESPFYPNENGKMQGRKVLVEEWDEDHCGR